MKGKIVPLKIRYSVYVLSFVLAVAATYFMLPQGKDFDKQFEEGRPWNYELLTAPADFAIYKGDDELEAERDSALRDLVPYFVSIHNDESELIDRMLETAKIDVGDRTANLAVKLLREVYSTGVMPLKEMQGMSVHGIGAIWLLDDKMVGSKTDLSKIFTPKTAYDHILSCIAAEEWADDAVVKLLRIDQYIEPNLHMDKDKTEQAKAELIGKVMLTSGMVQKGERIIDRGEVVSHETYKILNSLKRLQEDNPDGEKADGTWRVIGNIILIMIMYVMLFMYLKLFREKVLESVRATEFMVLIVLSMLGILWLVTSYFGLSEYYVPMAMLPLVLRVFFDSRTAFFMNIVAVLLAAQMVPDPMVFVLMQLVAGMVAVSSLKTMNSRAQLLKSAILVFICYSVTYISHELATGADIADIEWTRIVVFAINAVALLFVYGLIFIIEKVFGFLSEVTLVELSNVNSPLLMEFSEKCPGTFQHVLQVSNLSVEVAKKIGANVLLVRTGALYHDLGKMENPMYYTENQTGVNPLNDLPFEEAAQIIISHVTAGVKIAKKHRLPYQIIEFIRMHHGTSKAKYFYNSFKNKYPGREIDENKFTYPGPLPSTKETAILMMSDSVEAASRSLTSYSDESIDKLVENVVNGQIADGQFKNAPISFRDVEVAKEVLKGKLKNVYHTRIKYPELKDTKDKDSGLGSLLNFTSKLNGGRKPYRFQKK